MDGTTADGALLRFVEAPDAPMNVIIGATTHPGGLDADPFAVTPFLDARPSGVAQFGADVDFVRRALAGAPVGHTVSYVVLGTDVWKTTPTWPPAGVVSWNLGLAPDRLIAESGESGTIAYTVDPASTSGRSTAGVRRRAVASSTAISVRRRASGSSSRRRRLPMTWSSSARLSSAWS